MDHARKNRKIIITSLLIIIAGFTIMTGWIFDIPALQSIVPGFVGMRFNAALCFVLFGTALLLFQYRERKYNMVLYYTLSLTATLIGLITFAQDIFHFNSGLDQFFVFDKVARSATFPFPGRMAFNASVNVLFLGFGFLALPLKKPLFKILTQCFFNFVTIFSAIALIGYLYGVSFVRAILYETSMATHTAILFFIVSLAAALLNPSIGLTRLFTGKRVGNRMAKRLSILMILMVVMFGSLKEQTQRFELFSSMDIGVSILVVCFLVVSLLLIWNTANWLNKIDRRRSEAEAKVKLMNAELEKIVEERSAEFRKSEEKYRSLIEQASDAIYVLDFNGNFTEVNASMCNMMGYNREELLRLNVESIMDPEELKTDPATHGPRNTNKSIIRERTFVRKDGDMFTVEINVKMFSDDRIMVIARDISDRKKMETELREAELKFRTIADKSMVGVYIVQNGMFAYVNPRFAGMFGYETEELVNTPDPAEKIFHESYLAIVAENVRLRIEGEIESVRYEAMGKKKDGTNNWIEIYGNRVIIGGKPAIIGSAIDITERKKAEGSLQKSEANLQTILNTTDTAYALFDTDLKVLAFNQRAVHFIAEQYGHIPEKGDKLTDYSPQDKSPRFISFTKDVLQGKNINYEVDYQKKDGPLLWYDVRLFPIRNNNSEILGMMMALYDITERKNAEQDLKNAYERIQSHINSIKDMAWKQSHLIRSPLANLKGLAAMLKDDPSDIGLCDHIKTELERMDDIIIEMAEEASDHELID